MQKNQPIYNELPTVISGTRLDVNAKPGECGKSDNWLVVEKNSYLAGEPGMTINREMTVGKDKENDIVLDDRYASRRHARFFLHDNRLFLEDSGSKNGTFVNQIRISDKCSLVDGCEIKFGNSVFVVLDGSDLLNPVKSTIIKTFKAETPVVPFSRHYKNITQPCLIGASEPYLNNFFPLDKNKPTYIGRADEKLNQIVLNDKSVSGTHATIFYEDGIWKIANTLSTNGTFVNESKIIGQHFLSTGDAINIGYACFYFVSGQPEAPSTESPSFLTRWVSWIRKKFGF